MTTIFTEQNVATIVAIYVLLSSVQISLLAALVVARFGDQK